MTTTRILLDGEHLVAEALDAGVKIDLVLTDGDAPRAGEARAGRGARGVRRVRMPSSKRRVRCGRRAAWSRSRTGSRRRCADLFTRTPALVIGLVDVQDPGNVGSVDPQRGRARRDRRRDARRDAPIRPAGRPCGRDGQHVPPAGRARQRLASSSPKRGARASRIAATVAAGGSVDRTRADLPVAARCCCSATKAPAWTPDALAARRRPAHRPDAAGVDSLNVAVTAALILYEARRQRAGAHGP